MAVLRWYIKIFTQNLQNLIRILCDGVQRYTVQFVFSWWSKCYSIAFSIGFRFVHLFMGRYHVQNVQ